MIRKMQPQKDLEAIMQIWYKENLCAHDFIPTAYWKKQFSAVQDALPQAEVYVWEEQGKILGFLGVIEAYIAGVFVDSSVHATGIGTRLLEHVKRMRQYLTLHVYQKNERAVRFYQHNGFVIQEVQTDFDTGEPEYLMQWN